MWIFHVEDFLFSEIVILLSLGAETMTIPYDYPAVLLDQESIKQLSKIFIFCSAKL